MKENTLEEIIDKIAREGKVNIDKFEKILNEKLDEIAKGVIKDGS